MNERLQPGKTKYGFGQNAQDKEKRQCWAGVLTHRVRLNALAEIRHVTHGYGYQCNPSKRDRARYGSDRLLL